MNKDPLEIAYQDLNIHDIIKERYFCYVYILIIIILLLGIKVLISSIQIHALILYMLEKNIHHPLRKN